MSLNDEWDDEYTRWQIKADTANKDKKTVPVRPVLQRLLHNTGHFVIMTANTTPWNGWKRRGMRYALIELADPKVIPSRIDARLKAVRRILAIRTVYNLRHPKGWFIQKRYWYELQALAVRCERLYPCHFLVKGIDYAPPKTYLESGELCDQAQAAAPKAQAGREAA